MIFGNIFIPGCIIHGWMYYPGVNKRMLEEKGKVEGLYVLILLMIVAVTFTVVGHSIASPGYSQNQVEDYLKNASENEVRDILSVVPEDILSSQVEKKYPLLVEDDLGRKVIIEEKPENIISLSPSVTETLFALGLENRIIGVSEACDYPSRVVGMREKGEIKTVAPYAGAVKTEKVLNLNPSLVVGAAGTPMDSIEEMEKVGITFVGVEGENIPTVKEGIELIGQVTGTSETAQKITENIQHKIDEIAEITENIARENKPTVYYEVWELWTVGPGTFLHEIIVRAGGINIAENSEAKYPKVKEETIVGKNPDFFITGKDARTTKKSVKEDYPGITAVEENQIVLLDKEMRDVFSRPGPRLPMAVQELTKILYPELEDSF